MSTFDNKFKGVVQLGMKIETLDDLEPLRIPYQQGTLKLNLSEIGRTLNLNRRTIKAYLLIIPKTCRRTYNDRCRKCRNECKQSFKAVIVFCPKYQSKRSAKNAPNSDKFNDSS